MNDMPANPRAVPGDNQAPDYAQHVTDQMARNYAETIKTLDGFMIEAREAPAVLADDATALSIGAIIKRLRDVDGRLEKFRIVEKEPYLRGGEAVDAYFFGQRDRIGRRKRTDKPGAADVLQARIDDFQQRKLAAEQARRDQEARETARKEAEAREAREKAEREARETQEAADRARKPETVAAKAEVAEQAAGAASAAKVEEAVAADRAQDAYIATLAKPADMVRTRGDDGVTLTMAKENYAIVVDQTKLDYAKLAPYFSLDAIEKALRGWSKNTGYREQMAGAEIGTRNKSVVR